MSSISYARMIGKERWIYMAAAMSDLLQQIIRNRYVKAGQFPENVRLAVTDYLQLLEQSSQMPFLSSNFLETQICAYPRSSSKKAPYDVGPKSRTNAQSLTE